MDNSTLEGLRENYRQQQLTEERAGHSPFELFGRWMEEALAACVPEANAMTLATNGPDGSPSARIVLLKGFSKDGFVFYTNYESEKGRQLANNPRAALVFFWPQLERQVRVQGLVHKSSAEVSDSYFSSRPLESQIGAIISPQSQVIADRTNLDEQFNHFTSKDLEKPLKRPENWGGFVLAPQKIEFWQGRPGRLHDRLLFSLKQNEIWSVSRLAP